MYSLMKLPKNLILMAALLFIFSCGETTSKSGQKSPAENQKKGSEVPLRDQRKDSILHKPVKKTKKQKSRDTLKPRIATDLDFPEKNQVSEPLSK